MLSDRIESNSDTSSIDAPYSSDDSNNSLTANICIEDDDESEPTTTTTTDTAENLIPKEPIKRKILSWTKIASFKTYTEAHESVIAENYKKHGIKKGNGGSKMNFRCGKIKQRSKIQCESKMRICQSASDSAFEVESNNAPHTCGDVEPNHQSKSISKEMKDMIINCAQSHMKPKFIVSHINALREEHGLFLNEETPNIASIYYILKSHKLVKAPKMEYLGELIEWCDNNMDEPSDIDKPFVIGLDHSNEDEALRFRLVVTTKRLLEHSKSITHLCVDATYKLTWHDYPFMVLGTVDRNKKFHPLCFALCTQETAQDYKFVFETLSNNVKKYTDGELLPKILISDASNAIRNAFMATFPMALLMIMCYVHVLRNIGKNKDKYQKENKNEIFHDIEMLHQSSSAKVFGILSRLFLKKWKKKEPEFARYFEKQWLQSHCNWFLGAASYTPTTNNGVEGETHSFSFLHIIACEVNKRK